MMSFSEMGVQYFLFMGPFPRTIKMYTSIKMLILQDNKCTKMYNSPNLQFVKYAASLGIRRGI